MIDLEDEHNLDGVISIFLTELSDLRKRRNKQIRASIQRNKVPEHAHVFVAETVNGWCGRIIWHTSGPSKKPHIDNTYYFIAH